MKKVFLIFNFMAPACFLNAQVISCDTINSNKKMSYGIGAGTILFPYTSQGGAPVKWYYATNYYKDGLENLFYEPRPFLAVAEFSFNKKENFHHLIGASFLFRKFDGGGSSSGRSNMVTYKGLYIYYQNQFLFRKYLKSRFIKNLFAGGRIIITGKDMITYYEFHNGPNQNGAGVFTDKNLMEAIGFTCGYKKIWERFFFDFGINWSVLAIAGGLYFPNSKGFPEAEKYFAFMTPFGNSMLNLKVGDLRPVTFTFKLGYKIKIPNKKL